LGARSWKGSGKEGKQKVAFGSKQKGEDPVGSSGPEEGKSSGEVGGKSSKRRWGSEGAPTKGFRKYQGNHGGKPDQHA